MTWDELVLKAEAELSALQALADGDPATDPVAAKAQQLGARLDAGLPICNPRIATDAYREFKALEPLRKNANQAMLRDG